MKRPTEAEKTSTEDLARELFNETPECHEDEPWSEWEARWIATASPLIEKYSAALRAEVEELRQRELLASGYHKRTEREIEISTALEETPEHDRDSADLAIGELLLLVDAGRNRVHVAECKAEEAQAEGARLRPVLEKARQALLIANVNMHNPMATGELRKDVIRPSLAAIQEALAASPASGAVESPESAFNRGAREGWMRCGAYYVDVNFESEPEQMANVDKRWPLPPAPSAPDAIGGGE